MTVDRRCALYRFYDAADQLLYVGVSIRPTARFRQHSSDKPWWPDVARKQIDWHPNSVIARQAEVQLIEAGRPKFNVRGKEPWDLARATRRVHRAHSPQRPLKPQCPHGHLFTEENTRVDPQGFRRCRTCVREQARSRRQREKFIAPEAVQWEKLRDAERLLAAAVEALGAAGLPAYGPTLDYAMSALNRVETFLSADRQTLLHEPRARRD